jgi:peroxiredoxin
MKSLIRLVLYAVIACNCVPPAWSAAVDPYQAMGIDRPDSTVPAPGFTLTTLDGMQVSLADYHGKVVLLNYWATWCAPCLREMPGLQRLWERYNDKDLVVLAVSEDDGKQQQVTDFVRKAKVRFPILMDRDFKIANRYVLPALPTSYLIGRNGTIAATIVGAQEWSRHAARTFIDYLLNPH